MFTQTMVRTHFIKGTVLKVLVVGLFSLSFYSYAAIANAAILTVDVDCVDSVPEDSACDIAGTYKTIEDALAASNNNDTISLNSDVTIATQLNLKEGMTLDGNGKKMYANFTKVDFSNNSGIGILNSNVTVQNLVIDGAGGIDLHGINVYLSTGVTLNSVTVSNFRSGIVVNGSTVTATNLNTSGNEWNSVNVDPGSDVTANSVFTLASGNLNDASQIWSDGGNVTAGFPEVIVNAEGYTKYKKGGTEDSYLWSDSTPDGVLNGTTIYASLQAAIAGATAGDTINLGSGTYNEVGQIVIDKDLTIVGDATDLPVIQPTGNFLGDNASGSWWLIEGGVAFNLSNVVLDGDGSLINRGLRSHGNTTIDNVDFTNIAGNATQGMAVVNFGGTVPGGAGADSHSVGGPAADLTITNSTFSNIGRIGVLIKGTESTATLTGNTYTGKGDGTHLDYAFEMGAGGSAIISNNTITGNRGVAADTSTSAGILITEYYGSGSNAIVSDNTFANNSVGLHIGYLSNDSSVVTAYGNDFSGETIGVKSVATTVAVNAENNWWGSVNEVDVDAKADGDIDFTPWYLSADMTITSEAISGDTLTSPTDDVVLGASGEADLPAGVTDIVLSNGSNLDLSAGLDSDEVIVLNSGVEGESIILTNSDMPGITVSFPDETTIDGPNDWDGLLLPPTVGTAGGSAPSGFAVGNTVITVGSNDGVLIFDKPVTILLPGVTGVVAYKPSDSNTWVQIENVCTDYANPTGAPVGGECYVSNGVDTKISTYHFTSFGNLVAVKKSGSSGSKAKRATPAIPAIPGVSPATPATPAVPAVAGASTYKFTQEFGFGAEGSQVSELQKKLSLVGLFTGPVTGYFGPLTQAALRNFQSSNGITATGYVGPLTLAQLNEETVTTVSNSTPAQLEAKQLELINLLKQLLAQLTAAR